MSDENVEQSEETETPADAEPEAVEPTAEAEQPEPEAAAEETEPAEQAEQAEEHVTEPVAEAEPAPEADAEAEQPEPAEAAEPAEDAAPAAAAVEAPAKKKKKKRLPRALRPQRSKQPREKPAERKPITRLEKPEHERGRRQERQGTVVSAAADKTIVVRVDTVKLHPTYKKVIRRSTKLHAHDESNEAKVGDVVRIVETRPLSKLKRWRLQEVVEVAK
jgi:small subunit ribosomal protein S17